MTGRAPPLALALGVSRVARLTTLDRCGVEVASAIRPRGHVLQATQGKGPTWAAAVASALGEAAELWAAETLPLERLVWSRDDDGLSCAFIEGQWLLDGGAALVRAEAVFCPPSGTAWLGPSVESWSSNGLAAHRTTKGAAEHAVLELVERDAVAKSLPRGWTPEEAVARLLAPELPLLGLLEARGFAAFTFDLTPPRGRVPVVAALLFDREGGSIPLTAGYAARRTGEAAAEAALLEAAQSRLTEVHGAREDVAAGERVAGKELFEVLSRARPRRTLAKLVNARTKDLEALADSDVAIVELASEPLHVVKAVSPALGVSHLL